MIFFTAVLLIECILSDWIIFAYGAVVEACVHRGRADLPSFILILNTAFAYLHISARTGRNFCLRAGVL